MAYIYIKYSKMKAKLKSATRRIGQAYANMIISRLQKCESLFEYEHLMRQGLLLDYCFTEYLNIYLD